MAKKEFKTESKKLLDMMINSIYTHDEIFLRELISNASDAIDKLYFKSLTDDSVKLAKSDYEIRITADKADRTLTITDNGIGMTQEDLENNLGTIAKSGSFDFKKDNCKEDTQDIDIIGQFGVGFYSSFMVASKVEVKSKAFGCDQAWAWTSEGVDGYTIEPCDKDDYGTEIVLHIKEDVEDENYSKFLETWELKNLVKKYSDYVRYPIKMMEEKRVPVETAAPAEGEEPKAPEFKTVMEDSTLNSMIPIWKKKKSEITEEDYNNFYMEKFRDYEAPLEVINQKTEGMVNYEALLFIPKHAPYDYYSKDYESGLKLYSSGVLIMEKCKDLLPDYFNFVTGLVDSADLSLNISREMLQHNRQLKSISKALEKKIASTLKNMLEKDREKYEKFYEAFGLQLKFGIYQDFGAHKDVLQDLVMFASTKEDKPVTLAEYVSRMPEDQDKIYYACGESVEKISMLPQVEAVKDHDREVLLMTDEIDEFMLQMLYMYNDKSFLNVCKENLDLGTEEEKETVKKLNEDNKDMLAYMQEVMGGNVTEVRFTNSLKNHPVCLSSEGDISIEMEKVLSRMPGEEPKMAKAQIVMEINADHDIKDKLIQLYADDKDTLASYSKILYANARLISDLPIDNPAEFSELVCELMTK